jgi:hypothetical protein
MRSTLTGLIWMALTSMLMADPARVAIISDSENRNLATLVTTELSSNTAVSLLERDDLAKIGEEAKVQQMASSDATALGRLANADGLLFLDQRADGTHVRFTAVNLGYALFDDPVPVGTDAQQEAKAIAHLVVGDAPKLKLDPAKAIPLSILNLRADFSTPESTKVERDLTLLLESRLAAVPEVVVLERRHAWSLNFEHSLSIEANPVLRGACLIDGSLDVKDDACAVSLRVRKPGDEIGRQVTVSGKTGDCEKLADDLIVEIKKALGQNVSEPQQASATEANEYLAEALWGWRAHVPDAALEAVDSAELLGAPPEFVLPVRIQILCDLADRGMERWLPPFDQQDPTFDADALAQKVAILKRAISDTVRYRNEKWEDKLGQFVPSNGAERVNFRTGETVARAAVISSKTLFLLDQKSLAQADELRLELRSITGYDPLHGQAGQVGNGPMANNSNAADVFSDNWAQSAEEEVAWLRLKCLDSSQILPRYSIDEPAKRFCARFFSDPADREKKFDEFVESLKNDPKAQRTYLVLKTHEGDPTVAKAAFVAYIAEMLSHKEEIATGNAYSPLVESIWYLGPTTQQDTVEALPLVHAVLDSPEPGQAGIIVLKNLWHSADTAPADAARIWKEEQAYVKRRTEIVMQKERRPDDSFLAEMDSIMYYFKEKYPDIIKPQPDMDSTAASPMIVTRFWYPWKVSDVPMTSGVIINSMVAGDDDTLWLTAYVSQLEKSRVFKVRLSDLSASMIDIDGTSNEGLLYTSQALYLPLYSRGTTSGYWQQLCRYDFSTSAWEKRTLAVSFQPQHMACINGSIYIETAAGGPGFGDREVGLAKYDWDDDKLTILAGSRRRPGQNQFDDTAPYRIDGIFTGPGGRPAVTTDTGTYYIQETPGTWPAVFDGRFNDSVATEDGRSLILNGQGEATYIDPKETAPIPWMAADAPLYRRAKGLPGVTGPVPTPWAKEAIWDCPPGKQKWMYPGAVAFRGGRLFILNQPNPTEDRFELLCYDRAFGRKPVHIPLSFQLTDIDKPELEKHPGSLPNGFRLDQLEHPHSPFIPRVTGTSLGLCLTIQEAGFWFVPFADIDAYLKANR